ncbi:MAG TPA: metal-dependent hydrolase [Nitrospiraceae bacterium]|nr:metal-dependent hydrolase [Nitrospiraceae bacterium]
MASPITHAVVALSLGSAWHRVPSDWRLLAWGVICAEAPDADVLGFAFGVPYGHLWGHRGMTHSLLFASLLAVAVTYATRSSFGHPPFNRWLYFFFATASHGLSDAVTNGGLGVALFAPFDATRYFFPFRPVIVSPLGVQEFFSPIGVRVLISEAIWIWLPCLVFAGASLAWRCRLAARRGNEPVARV